MQPQPYLCVVVPATFRVYRSCPLPICATAHGTDDLANPKLLFVVQDQTGTTISPDSDDFCVLGASTFGRDRDCESRFIDWH